MATLELTSPAFEVGGFLPARYGPDGENVSPPLSWSLPPDETAELVLVCEDLDAGPDPFVHWLVSGIEPDSEGVEEGQVPPGGVVGLNGHGGRGWTGPEPSVGEDPHRYVFRLYALRDFSELGEEAGGDEARALLDSADVLAEGELVARYARTG